ncbi:MAG TPA: hypothetical protein DCL15_20595 [Chloroflexi bacterium]|nr:hypothetical protein [Chloroflexota bacterium]HHW84940.1 hypothetical protein [Chloroflexota bacterium]
MNAAQFTAPNQPAFEADESLTALTFSGQLVAGGVLLSVVLPPGVVRARLAGRYFLAHCGDASLWGRAHDWSFYLRRPLFVAAWRPATTDLHGERWLLTTPDVNDPGVGWLTMRPPATPINLIGPLGNGFELPARTRQLAIVSTPGRVAALLPLLHTMLDSGGRVVVLLQGDGAIDPALRDLLPFAAEVQQAAPGADWQAQLQAVVSWADVVAAALPGAALPSLIEAVRTVRLHVERGFAQALVDVRLACGYGACHACLTPLGNGRWTRACVHGPVFDLADLGK